MGLAFFQLIERLIAYGLPQPLRVFIYLINLA